MQTKIKFSLIFVLTILACGTAAWAPESSVYRITLETMAGGAGRGSSANHTLMGVLANRELLELYSQSYRTRQGFIPGVFETIFAPIITSIDPDEGYNIAPITIDSISGANFASGIDVRLTATGETDIVAYDVNVASSREITCKFNLAGAAAGLWDLVLTNLDNQRGILPSGFKINSYPLSLGLVINSPNPFDPAKENTIIMYRLEEDTNVNIYLFTITADLVWKRSFNAGENGGRAGDNDIIWNGINDFGEMSPNTIYLIHVVNRRTGRTLARGKIAVLRLP
jgi:hypothetical protein